MATYGGTLAQTTPAAGVTYNYYTVTNGAAYVGGEWSGSGQTIATITETNLSFSTETRDSHGFFAPTGTQFTVPTGLDGMYLCTLNFASTIAVGAVRSYVQIKKNAGTVFFRSGFGVDESTIACTALIRLAAGDYIQGQVYQATGGNITASHTMTIQRVSLV